MRRRLVVTESQAHVTGYQWIISTRSLCDGISLLLLLQPIYDKLNLLQTASGTSFHSYILTNVTLMESFI